MDVIPLAPSLHDASADPSATTALELHFDLGNAAAMLDDAKAGKAATAMIEALEKVAGLLEEHSHSVEDELVKLVENAPVKEPVPVEQTSPSQSADKTSEDGAAWSAAIPGMEPNAGIAPLPVFFHAHIRLKMMSITMIAGD